MPDINPSLPEVGQPDATEEPKIVTALSQIVATVNDLDEANVPNLDAAFTKYDRLHRLAAELGTAAVAGQYGMSLGAKAVATAFNALPAADCIIHLDPAKYAANDRTTKLRLKLTQVQNSVPSSITATAALFPVATFAGTGPATPKVATLGTQVTGGSTAIASATSLVPVDAESGDFDCPTEGYYVVTLTTSGPVAANGAIDFVAELYMRQV